MRSKAVFGPSFLLLSLVLLSAPSASSGVRSSLADIGPAPPVALIDSDGKPFELDRLHGKVVLLRFTLGLRTYRAGEASLFGPKPEVRVQPKGEPQ